MCMLAGGEGRTVLGCRSLFRSRVPSTVLYKYNGGRERFSEDGMSTGRVVENCQGRGDEEVTSLHVSKYLHKVFNNNSFKVPFRGLTECGTVVFLNNFLLDICF